MYFFMDYLQKEKCLILIFEDDFVAHAVVLNFIIFGKSRAFTVKCSKLLREDLRLMFLLKSCCLVRIFKYLFLDIYISVVFFRDHLDLLLNKTNLPV